MRNYFSTLFFALLIFNVGCSEDDNAPVKKTMSLKFEFASDKEGWTEGFADYPQGEESSYELSYTHANLPDELDTSQGSLKISGNNHSDDLFMYIKRKITGLTPNGSYQVKFNVEVASNAPSNAFGVGGAPGESVYLKAGATTGEITTTVDNSGHHRMTLDKGNQEEDGKDMVLIGNVANGTDKDQYVLISKSNKDAFPVTADSNGELWVVIGTDSGFESVTTLYYNKISILFE
ncbi:hypothetical protein QQ020_20095 [Fulvivirgaceae bacterium BMA12]|uniref:Lipoprotein n=1 Tax=Agaribacillus aureus TaxID=3051825 RepID=A0ABT8L9G5_9BACT|nr:hypothetical protein [Fulvivirgaceae bacterium BMA12]